MVETSKPPLERGQSRIDRYLILEIFAETGQGICCFAFDYQKSAKVAVKTFAKPNNDEETLKKSEKNYFTELAFY